jgi:hypothetical protein
MLVDLGEKKNKLANNQRVKEEKDILIVMPALPAFSEHFLENASMFESAKL